MSWSENEQFSNLWVCFWGRQHRWHPPQTLGLPRRGRSPPAQKLPSLVSLTAHQEPWCSRMKSLFEQSSSDLEMKLFLGWLIWLWCPETHDNLFWRSTCILSTRFFDEVIQVWVVTCQGGADMKWPVDAFAARLVYPAQHRRRHHRRSSRWPFGHFIIIIIISSPSSPSSSSSPSSKTQLTY